MILNSPYILIYKIFIWLMIFTRSARADSVQNLTEMSNYVSYEELLNYTDSFAMDSVVRFDELYIDSAGSQIIVGARDHLFRLNLNNLHLLESSKWFADSNDKRLCFMSGYTAEDCKNHIRFLHVFDGALYVCGTNAFKPRCSIRSIDKLNNVKKVFSGRGWIPYSQDDSIASFHISSGEDFYITTYYDEVGYAAGIMKFTNTTLMTRITSHDRKWLSKPYFVSAFETSKFVYFLFQEEAEEQKTYSAVEKVSRIGRICKNDPGSPTQFTKKFSTFLKARLNCSHPGNSSFYYNHILSAAYLSEEMIYAVFTTPYASFKGTALCAFNMTAINRSFDGPFKYQEMFDDPWVPVTEEKPNFKCEDGPEGLGSDNATLAAEKYQLMYEAVSPVTPQPLLILDHLKMMHIAMDVVSTRQSGEVHVLYVMVDDNTVRKLSVIPGSDTAASTRTCLVEILQISPQNYYEEVKNFKFLKETNSLYIGTNNEVLRVSVDRCERYKTRSSCLEAMDPYCGWDTVEESCTTAPNNDPQASSWIQEVITCPGRLEPEDGSLDDWSNWRQCRQAGTDDYCQCRFRQCDSPKPSETGNKCTEDDTEVKNCTIHGGWTSWSPWSECTATCGIAVKTRSRTCTNPAPQHGGRVCVGLEKEDISCDSLPKCFNITTVRKLSPMTSWEPVDGMPGIEKSYKVECSADVAEPDQLHYGRLIQCTSEGHCLPVPFKGDIVSWTNWSSWSTCSTTCGVGTRTRQRTCNLDSCYGSAIDDHPCIIQPC